MIEAAVVGRRLVSNRVIGGLHGIALAASSILAWNQQKSASVAIRKFAIASNFFGLWLARRTPTELFYKLAYLLMLLISLALLWQGTSAFLLS